MVKIILIVLRWSPSNCIKIFHNLSSKWEVYELLTSKKRCPFSSFLELPGICIHTCIYKRLMFKWQIMDWRHIKGFGWNSLQCSTKYGESSPPPYQWSHDHHMICRTGTTRRGPTYQETSGWNFIDGAHLHLTFV